jgi:sulfiredoxin
MQRRLTTGRNEHIQIEEPQEASVAYGCAKEAERCMMKRETLTIADIYVPVKRRATLEQERVDEIAASMLEKGQQTPILVRPDRARFVLIEGLHRLEAAKALGEKTIIGFLVDDVKSQTKRKSGLKIHPIHLFRVVSNDKS